MSVKKRADAQRGMQEGLRSSIFVNGRDAAKAPPHYASSARATRATGSFVPPSVRVRARGGATVEYVVLVASVGVVVAAALVGFGPSFVRHFELMRTLALLPAP